MTTETERRTDFLVLLPNESEGLDHDLSAGVGAVDLLAEHDGERLDLFTSPLDEY